MDFRECDKMNKSVKGGSMKKRIAIIILIMSIVFLIISFKPKEENNKKESQPIEWTELKLSSFLEQPSKTIGIIHGDLDTYLSITIENISNEEYENYKEKCKNKYHIESKEDNHSYQAFDDKGYQLRLFYTKNELDIHLEAPEEYQKIEWPTNGLDTFLPVPKSDYGKISWDNQTTFIIHLEKMTVGDLIEYKEECKKKGFTTIETDTDRVFQATDSKNRELHLTYLGFQRIEIALYEKEKTEEEQESVLEDDFPYNAFINYKQNATHEELYLINTNNNACKYIEIARGHRTGEVLSAYKSSCSFQGDYYVRFTIDSKEFVKNEDDTYTEYIEGREYNMYKTTTLEHAKYIYELYEKNS